MSEPLESLSDEALRARVRELEATVERMTAASAYAAAKAASQLQHATSKLHVVETERDALRRNYELLREQHELLKRRVYRAKAERLDVRQLEIEFAAQQKRLDAMAAELGLPATPPSPPPPRAWRQEENGSALEGAP